MSIPEHNIRLAIPTDADALFKLNELFNGRGCATKQHILDSLRDNGREVVLIATMEGKGVGYLCAQRVESMCYSTPHASIEELFVREDCRRGGVGEALLRAALDHFAGLGITHFHLATGVENRRARPLYEKLGFKASDHLLYTKG